MSICFQHFNPNNYVLSNLVSRPFVADPALSDQRDQVVCYACLPLGM